MLDIRFDKEGEIAPDLGENDGIWQMVLFISAMDLFSKADNVPRSNRRSLEADNVFRSNR